jgi:hypothetical protein
MNLFELLQSVKTGSTKAKIMLFGFFGVIVWLQFFLFLSTQDAEFYARLGQLLKHSLLSYIPSEHELSSFEVGRHKEYFKELFWSSYMLQWANIAILIGGGYFVFKLLMKENEAFRDWFQEKFGSKREIVEGTDILKGNKLSQYATKEITTKQPFVRYIYNNNLWNIPISESDLVRHTLVVGAPGSGKTNFLMGEFDSFGKTIVHDFKGDFVEVKYLESDLILNPFDKRSVRWTVCNDILSEEDIPAVASAFVPETKDEYWGKAARDVLIAIFSIAIQKQQKSNADILNFLNYNADRLVDLFHKYDKQTALKHIKNPDSKQTQGAYYLF